MAWYTPDLYSYRGRGHDGRGWSYREGRTWKLVCEASMATEIGPTVATAFSRSSSLLDLTSTNPVRLAPELAAL